ncbi:hypothetical protein DNK56_17110 [Streptomyces sp. AC1-42W]|nr:hypothetical protein DNK55_14315 [Streptomyces sp. AC1-42T]PZT83556.1 hypothetical protein DNK56_17110 [Streptomyces sp. AC1-42W]
MRCGRAVGGAAPEPGREPAAACARHPDHAEHRRHGPGHGRPALGRDPQEVFGRPQRPLRRGRAGLRRPAHRRARRRTGRGVGARAGPDGALCGVQAGRGRHIAGDVGAPVRRRDAARTALPARLPPVR